MRAKLRVPSGAPDHSSGGEMSAPSHVYFTGIGSFGANVGEEIVNGIVRRPELVWWSSCALSLTSASVSAGAERLDLSQPIIASGSAQTNRRCPNVIRAILVVGRIRCTIRALGREKAHPIVRKAIACRGTGERKDSSVFFLITVGAEFV